MDWLHIASQNHYQNYILITTVGLLEFLHDWKFVWFQTKQSYGCTEIILIYRVIWISTFKVSTEMLILAVHYHSTWMMILFKICLPISLSKRNYITPNLTYKFAVTDFVWFLSFILIWFSAIKYHFVTFYFMRVRTCFVWTVPKAYW